MNFKQWLLSEEIDPSVAPQGKYYMIQMVETKPDFQGLGIGKLLYQLALQTSPEDIIGIASDTKGRMSGAGPVTGIYKKLGGVTGLQSRDGVTWDFLIKRTMPQVRLSSRRAGDKNLIYSIDTKKGPIHFDRQDLGREAVVSAWTDDFRNRVASISTDTVNWYPSEGKYYLPEDDPNAAGGAQVGGGKGELTLVPAETNKPIPVRIDATIGSAVIQTPSAQRFMSQRQFALKRSNGAWTIAHSPEAKNSTNVNGKPLGFSPQPLSDGDTITLGKTGQVPVRVSLS